MVSQGLSDSTVRKYAGAIDGPLTDWANQHAIIRHPVRTIRNSLEFAAFSELIEGTDVFAERNARGNHMYGAALNNYARYLTALALTDGKTSSVTLSQELVAIEAAEADISPFQPLGKKDGRERVLREVVRRQGQPQFRAKLIAAYGGRCAITSCSLLVILEAAHITPYLGPETNHVSNGLLLRADLHTLWDLGLVAINPKTMLLAFSSEVNDADYQALAGTPAHLPLHEASRPSIAALQEQWSIFSRAV